MGFPALCFLVVSYKKTVLNPLKRRLLSSPDSDDHADNDAVASDDHVDYQSNPFGELTTRQFFTQKSVIGGILLVVFALVMSVVSLYVTIKKHFLS